MRPLNATAVSLTALLLAGCLDGETTQRIEREERQISSIVALLVGYDSDGLASMLADLAADTLLADAGRPLVIPAAGVSGPLQERVQTRSRGGISALGESRTRSVVRPEPAAHHVGGGEGISVDIDGTSLHASTSLAIRAATRGTIHLAAAGRLLERSASGELTISGSLGERPGDTLPFSQVEATLSWSRLMLLEDGPRIPRLVGTVAVSVAANGPGGLVLRNGTLILTGTDRAELDIAGRRYRIDVRRARVVR